jgi:hypothetical protein
VEQFNLSKLSASETASVKKRLESFIFHSLMEIPPQWYQSAEDIEMHKAQLTRQLVETPTETQPDQIHERMGSAKSAFIERAKQLIDVLDKGSEIQLDVGNHPDIHTREISNQETKEPFGFGIMLPEKSSDSEDQHLYLMHPLTSVNGTTIGERSFGDASVASLPKTVRDSVVKTLESLVSLLEKPSVTTQHSSWGALAKNVSSFFSGPVV